MPATILFIKMWNHFSAMDHCDNQAVTDAIGNLEVSLVVSDLCSARKPKVPGSNPAASYVQRWAVCSNCLANV